MAELLVRLGSRKDEPLQLNTEFGFSLGPRWRISKAHIASVAVSVQLPSSLALFWTE